MGQERAPGEGRILVVTVERGEKDASGIVVTGVAIATRSR